ncbi:MAG: Lrp/AsnC family transcriptional regulator [bacterium]|mgnify:CR=1 FL=1|nr:Lrp/AsnC family transcriptional regulator [bacterium]
MKNLDVLDRRILFELDHNSRQSISTLARELRQGRDRVEYRMQRLFDQKIIQRCFAYIDLNKLGLTLF